MTSYSNAEQEEPTTGLPTTDSQFNGPDGLGFGLYDSRVFRPFGSNTTYTRCNMSLTFLGRPFSGTAPPIPISLALPQMLSPLRPPPAVLDRVLLLTKWVTWLRPSIPALNLSREPMEPMELWTHIKHVQLDGY